MKAGFRGASSWTAAASASSPVGVRGGSSSMETKRPLLIRSLIVGTRRPYPRMTSRDGGARGLVRAGHGGFLVADEELVWNLDVGGQGGDGVQLFGGEVDVRGRGVGAELVDGFGPDDHGGDGRSGQ